MKNIIASILVICFLSGCSSFRSKGEPYSGYTCQQSLIHYYSHCYNQNISKDELNDKIKTCEKELASSFCDKEQADLLWCMGRTAPGVYSSGGAVCGQWFCSGSSSSSDGCDCSPFIGRLKECKMNNGIFEK